MVLFAIMILLFFLGFPIGLSMLLASFFVILASGEFMNFLMLPTKMVGSLNSFPLLAIPFFMLAGELMNTAGITDRVFNFARAIASHIMGGLGHVNVLASMIFAGMSGSGLADAAGLGQVEVKAMRDAGYDGKFSAAVTATSACIGPIIPPSIPMVICGLVTEQSVGKLLLGGAIPGIMMGLGLMVVVYLLARKRGYPSFPRPPIVEMARAFLRAFFPMMTPAILVGGIIFGIFTPTEAAVVTCVYALILGIIVYRQLSLRQIYRTFLVVGIRTGSIAIIIAGAQVLGNLTVQDMLPQRLSMAMVGVTTNPELLLLLIIFMFLFLGCFMSDLALLIIMGPMLMPLVIKVGIDPIHFGVVMVLVLQLGMITPPYGVVMFIVNMWADINVPQFAREVIPFFMILVVVSVALIFFPKLVLFLPNLIITR